MRSPFTSTLTIHSLSLPKKLSGACARLASRQVTLLVMKWRDRHSKSLTAVMLGVRGKFQLIQNFYDFEFRS